MTSVAQPINPTPTKSLHSNVNPSEVGWQFVPQYYTFVNKHPQRLHCFYTKNSTFIHGTEGEDGKPCYGQQEIHQKIMSLNYVNCKVFINSVDAQSSANNGIIIQVIGEMSNRGDPWKKFVQTFFLAEQPNGYFVLNDVFRFLKEESVGEEDEEELEHGEAPVQVSGDQSTDPHPIVPIDQVAVPYDSENVPSPSPSSEQINIPLPTAEPSTADVQLNGANGHSSPFAAESELVEEKEEASGEVEQLVEVPSAPATPAPESIPDVPAAEASEDPTTESSESLLPAASAPSAAAAVIAPQANVQMHAPAPSVPSGPKTWATLAASNNRKWGSQIAQEAKGVSAAAPPTPPTSTTPQPHQKGAHSANKGEAHPNAQAALTITSGQCFVKGVTENIPDTMLKDILTNRFGPIKELEIVRSKACAFLEFTSAEAARKAILTSLSPAQGGEGGVRMPHSGPGLPPRVTIEMRKERGERPVGRPRPGGSSPGDRGAPSGGHGVPSEGGRGGNTGSSLRGGGGRGGGPSRGRGGGVQK